MSEYSRRWNGLTQGSDVHCHTPLSASETHVWWMREAEVLTEMVEYALDFLDSEEKMTYTRYKMNAKKLEFAAGRILMKTMLGMYLHISPPLIRFNKNPYGKPYLRYFNTDLFFNISHSKGVVMCAVSHREIGVDIEGADEERYNVMPHVFNRQEIDWVDSKSNPRAKRNAFYTLWTCKEAAMKAVGKGFSLSPALVSVPLGPQSTHTDTYDFFTFEPVSGYIATVATERGESLPVRPVIREINPIQLYAAVRERWSTSN